MPDEVLVERRNSILVITINRPDARNAINRAVSFGLAAAMDELDTDPDLAVGIITGSGKNFCAGMDLKAFASGEKIVVPGRGLGFTESPPRKPLIAAIEGYALAGGMELVLASDLVVASREAVFGIPEVKRGLVAASGGLLRLPKRIPYQKALELALTGDNFTAEDGYQWGLVNSLTAVGKSFEGAWAMATRITANGPLAVAASKEVIVKSGAWPDDDAFDRQMQITGSVFRSKDAIEGSKAFAEKRQPVWTRS